MKKSLPLLIISAVLVVASACDRKQKTITSPTDYEKGAYFSGASTDEEKIRQSISFWKNRFKKHPGDLVALEKVASSYAASFKVNGRIENLFHSDSLFHLVLKKQSPHHAGIFRSLAANCISRHEFWKAKAHVERALSIGDDKPSSLLLLTDVMIELGNVDSAKVILQSFTNRNTFAWLIRQVKVLDHEGQLDSAIMLMEKAQQLVGMNDELFCWSRSNLADMYGHAGRIEDAYNAYRDVLQRKPDYDYARKGIAWVAYSHDRKNSDAEKIVQALIVRKPLPEYFLLLSEINEFTGNASLADKYVRTFIHEASKPGYGDMYNRHLIDLYAETNPDLALKLARREMQVRPTPESYDVLAWALYKNGHKETALQIAANFVEGRSHEPEVLMHLGEIYSSVNKPKSREYLEAALESSFEIGPLKSKKIQLILNAL